MLGQLWGNLGGTFDQPKNKQQTSRIQKPKTQSKSKQAASHKHEAKSNKQKEKQKGQSLGEPAGSIGQSWRNLGGILGQPFLKDFKIWGTFGLARAGSGN